MTDVNEHLSTSLPSETEIVKDSGVDAVSRERVDSETELNCSIETGEGDESITEGDEETKRDVATEEENPETEEENEILDVVKEDISKGLEASLKVGTERSGPEETLSNVGAEIQENVSITENLGSNSVERIEVGTSSNSPEQSSKAEDNSPKAEEHSSTVGENEKENSSVQEESSKADEECSKAEVACSKADEECADADKEFPKAAECLKAVEECSKADEEFPKAAECLKAVEECSKADEEFPKAAEECSKADEEYSKAGEEFPKAAECLKADEECSKADEEFPKAAECSNADKEFLEADKEYSKADEKCSKAGEEFSKADEEFSEADKVFSKADEECLKADEECSKTYEDSSNADKEYSDADKEFSKADEECLKADKEYSAADKDFSKTDEECVKADEEFSNARKEYSDADKEFSKADEEFSEADKEFSNKADEEFSEADKEFSKADEVCLKADEECSDAEEESSNSDEEYSEADEEFSEADKEFSNAMVQNTEIKEIIETPSSMVQGERSPVDEIEVEEITEEVFNAEEHSTKVEETSSNAEENSSKAEKNTEKEISKEQNAETEIDSDRKEITSPTEVWEENSGEGEDKQEEDEEEGDTEEEEGSSEATGTEQEDSEDDGENNEEEEDGSEKDADSVSGWDEKRDVGDGEEETVVKVEKKLDDDEDKANPAYIPRKGTFYEHDLRLEDVDDEEDKEDKEKQASGKRLWVDDHKWEHDRFDARQQAPKSPQELIDAYGFDIRRGKESDIPVRESMPRTRRPGDKNRFGDFVRRQGSEEHSGDDGENRDSNRTTSNRNRNRFNNENRRYQGRRENFRNNDAIVGFANSDFPALRQNVDIVVKTNTTVAEPIKEKSREERTGGNFRRRPDRRDSRDDEDMEDVETRGRNQSDRRGGASQRNNADFGRRRDRRGFVDEENEEDFDDRRKTWHERRGGGGGAFESRGAARFNRGRGRGRGGRWQRDRHEPDGRNLNWQQREDMNEERRDWNANGYRNRNSRNSESSVAEEIPQRNVGNQESRQRVDSEASQSGDLESRHSRQRDFDSEMSDYASRDGRNVRSDGRDAGGEQGWGYDRPRGRGRGKSGGRYEGTYESQEQRGRRGQEHSYRGQRPRQERDHRFREKDHQESFPTRTIQNSNIPGSGRPYSDAKTREEQKQELLSSVSAEIKKMNLNERELAAKQQTSHSSVNEKISDENLPGGYWQGRRFEQRGTEGDTRTVVEKPYFHKDISSAKPAIDENSMEVRRKPSVIIQTTDAPEMLPPVTTIQTFSRPAERTAPEPRPSSDRPPNKGWAGGEFTPAWRLQAAPPANKAETTHPAPSGKPKRYSTLRQKAAGAEAAYTEPVNADYQAVIGPASQPLTTALPSRPLPAATYYDSSSSYVAAPSFHTNPGLALGLHQMAYQMQANAQHGLYNNQPYNMSNPQVAKPGTPIQHMYMQHSGSMLPGPYMSMMNYPSHFPMAQVQLPPGAQPTHLHHGAMQDPESVEMHRMMYYNQQGIPMSVMQQYVDQTAYISEQSQVDHNVGHEGYINAGELTSQSQGAHEY